ncbi:methyltransferase domain-containing protein [Streptomyces ipomoeae]|uniref:Protein-L-isoaspartate O-methyltransferase n=2 Tax=Streptomyces ipomoeae TaxID=103232 RepID=L1KM26_9ACTN|nr:ATP-grasp peptide maturase system methyltransferase [Streptomyces ipomoeae]EKX61433.1 protein-L-isoaspartate(D-aspartate) O-methyltransferase (PCMT) [Streptomyces ipomoeae 91-03]MDX2697618.1 ATP-grasp peptide maturase system methyltransferase [Streptomyces ipomoeae]MDX2843406.1 ATP-grasp peptide maturase system methyltransferase [Streptomyces ipomoeae]TQE26445.1 methyltransferase domain-containing protein [Streptomyces ipomoeae]TQE37846.1 methyltransferase domain-containing protein [Strepto
MTSTASLRQGLADELAKHGQLTDPAWRSAVEAVPRDLFVGDVFFRPNGAQWEPVRRDRLGDDEWLRMVYSNTTWVTQVDGVSAADADGPLSGRPTSSSTLPSLVLRMVELADVHDGDKVLEIGTGTGYSTAILCHRIGGRSVYSVEYDEEVAAAAARHLQVAGYSPHLVVGDGLRGHQDGADYDTVIATCAVRTIPPSWLWQLRDGGSITTTISGWMLGSGLIRLVLDGEGVARGRFVGEPVSYMLARPHERPPRPTFYPRPGTTRSTQVSPVLLDDWTGLFVAQLAAPSAELVRTEGGIVLIDMATGSQAWTESDGEGWTVHQDGPLRLWDQVEDALSVWQKAGSPGQTAFGMTVTEWEQTVWLGTPDGPRWRLPT